MAAKYRIRLRKSELVNVEFQWLGAWRLRIDADDPSSSGIDTNVFLYLQGLPNPYDGSIDSSFMAVASPADLTEYPVGEPSPHTAYPIFRLDYVELDLRSLSLAQEVWTTIVEDVNQLCLAMDRMAQLVPTEEVWLGNATGFELSEQIGDTDVDIPQSAQSDTLAPVEPGQSVLTGADLRYLGSFRADLPPLTFGGWTIGYNPGNDSLFITASTGGSGGSRPLTMEITIPALSPSASLGDLATAVQLQAANDMTGGLASQLNFGNNGVRIGGMTVIDGQLYWTAYGYYDAAGAAQVFAGVSALDLSNPGAQGLYGLDVPLPPGAVVSGVRLTHVPAGAMGGYLSPVPAAWQATFGGPYYCGRAGGPIMARSSTGPTMVAFNPTAFGQGASPGKCWAFYPEGKNTQLHDWDPVGVQMIRGSFFVDTPARRGVAFLGWKPNGPTWYGLPRYTPGGDPALQPPNPAWVDQCDNSKGTHCLDGYTPTLWIYDPKVLLASLHPWDVQPVEYKLPPNPWLTAQECLKPDGVCHDPATGRLFVSTMGASVVGYGSYPLIHVYQYPV